MQELPCEGGLVGITFECLCEEEMAFIAGGDGAIPASVTPVPSAIVVSAITGVSAITVSLYNNCY